MAATSALAEQIVDGAAAWESRCAVAPASRWRVGARRCRCSALLATRNWTGAALASRLTDERWVREGSPGQQCRAGAAMNCCPDAPARRGSCRCYDGSASAAAAAGTVWESLRPLARPFDAVLLGMGEDGHFASLFPGEPGLPAALDVAAAPACVAMRAPVEPRERISLNLAALLQARRLFLFVTGVRQARAVAGRRAPRPKPAVAGDRAAGAAQSRARGVLGAVRSGRASMPTKPGQRRDAQHREQRRRDAMHQLHRDAVGKALAQEHRRHIGDQHAERGARDDQHAPRKTAWPSPRWRSASCRPSRRGRR